MSVQGSRAQPGLERASRLLGARDMRGAAEQCRRLLARDQRNVQALQILVQAHLGAGEIEGARYALGRLIEIAPAETGYRRQLAMTHRLMREFAEAHRVLDGALAIRPHDPVVRAAKSELHFVEGDYARAEAMLAPCLDATPVDPAVAQAFARLSGRIDARERAIELLKGAIGATQDLRTRSRLLFELGHLLDALKRYDEAFAAYDAGNRLKPAAIDESRYSAATERMIEAWSAEAVASVPRASGGTDAPVFIVGMPRSGTSLIEQMLASHPEVHGAGERVDLDEFVAELNGGGAPTANMLAAPALLTAKRVEQLAARYRATVDKARGERRLMTDKAPFNFMHLGLVQAICPGARVIHCIRDARDTSLSIYFNNLVGFHPPPPSLRGIGERHRLYEQVMAHWKSVLPLPTLDVVYEDLVGDIEGHARRMLTFLGLPWDECVLRFHESRRVTLTPSADQVRRPVYSSSSGRWRNYERHLGELFAGLGSQA